MVFRIRFPKFLAKVDILVRGQITKTLWIVKTDSPLKHLRGDNRCICSNEFTLKNNKQKLILFEEVHTTLRPIQDLDDKL